MTELPRNLADIALFLIVAWAHWPISARVLKKLKGRPAWGSTSIVVGQGIGGLWTATGVTLSYSSVTSRAGLNPALRGKWSGAAYVWAFTSTGAYLLWRIWRLALDRAAAVKFDPEKRRLMNTASSAM